MLYRREKIAKTNKQQKHYILLLCSRRKLCRFSLTEKNEPMKCVLCCEENNTDLWLNNLCNGKRSLIYRVHNQCTLGTLRRMCCKFARKRWEKRKTMLVFHPKIKKRRKETTVNFDATKLIFAHNNHTQFVNINVAQKIKQNAIYYQILQHSLIRACHWEYHFFGCGIGLLKCS